MTTENIALLIPNVSRFGTVIEISKKNLTLEKLNALQEKYKTLNQKLLFFNKSQAVLNQIIDFCKNNDIQITSIAPTIVPVDDNFIGFLPLDELYAYDTNTKNDDLKGLSPVWYIGLTKQAVAIKNTLTNEDIIVPKSTYLIQSYIYPNLSPQIMFTRNPAKLTEILPPITDEKWTQIEVANINTYKLPKSYFTTVDYDSF